MFAVVTAGLMLYADMTWLEADAHAEMYDRAGFLTTQDGAISILAGSTLGGGQSAALHSCKQKKPAIFLKYASRIPCCLPCLGPGVHRSKSAAPTNVSSASRVSNQPKEMLLLLPALSPMPCG